MKKCIFGTPHNEIKCVLSIKESNLERNGSKFSHLLTVRAEGAGQPVLPSFAVSWVPKGAIQPHKLRQFVVSSLQLAVCLKHSVL